MPLSDAKPEKWRISWEEFQMRTSSLLGEIRSKGQAYTPMAVLALGRGAAPLASVLSNVFGVKMYYLGLSSYQEDHQQGHLHITQYLPPAELRHLQIWGKNLLVVDDIWDTGKTFEYARSFFPTALFAALVLKDPENQPNLDPNFVWASTVGPKIWVEFPWEMNYG